MDCAIVQTAGPAAPPAMPGGEPGTDAAAFGAVIDPLLAADAAATAADAGAPVPPSPSQPAGASGTTGAASADAFPLAGTMLTAFAEASGISLQGTPAVDAASAAPGGATPAASETAVPPDDSDSEDASDDAAAPTELSAAIAAALVPQVVDPVALPPQLPLTGAHDPSASAAGDDGDGGVGAISAQSPAAQGSTAGPTPAGIPASNSLTTAAHTNPPATAAAAPAADAARPVGDPAGALVPADVTTAAPESVTASAALSSDSTATPAVIDEANRTDQPRAPQAMSQPDRATADAATGVAEGQQLLASSQLAPTGDGPQATGEGNQKTGDGREGNGRRATGDGRRTPADAPAGVSRAGAALAAQLRTPTGTATSGSAPVSHRAAEAVTPGSAAGAPFIDGTAPSPAASIGTRSDTGEIAPVQGMSSTAFGDANNNPPSSNGSGQGTAAPLVAETAASGWTGWPAGHLPAAAATALGHAATADDPVVPQLVKALHVQLRNGVGEARVQLEPHHLGAVSVALRVDNGVVSAVITAEQPAVRHWLETHESSLRGALAEQGLQLDRLRVEPDGQQARDRASTGQEPPPRRRMLRKETATFELVA